MSIFENPSFYVSIFSSVCFLISEVLPFLPIESNGVAHAILVGLSSYYKNPSKNSNCVAPPQHDNKKD